MPPKAALPLPRDFLCCLPQSEFLEAHSAKDLSERKEYNKGNPSIAIYKFYRYNQVSLVPI
jgi:hypothetical protein